MVPVRRSDQDIAGVLTHVERGEVVEITNAGLVAADLVLLAPMATGPISMPEGVAEPGSEAGEPLSTLRDEERW